MKKHLTKTISSDEAYKVNYFVKDHEAEGWELITPFQIIPPRQRSANNSEIGWVILTFVKEVQD